MEIRKLWPILLLAGVATATARGSSWQEEIPFKLAGGFGIVVTGGIGSANNLNLLFDTGAVPSVLSKRLASQMGITGTRGSFALLHQEIEAQYVTVGEVRFGPIHAAHLPMVVVDLSRLEGLLGKRVDAIIGLDIFAGQNFGIDYRRNKILPNSGGRIRHEIPAEIFTHDGSPYWVLRVNLRGQEFRMLLDTGANQVAIFSRNLPASLLEVRGDRRMGANATGEAETRMLALQELTIGDLHFKEQQVAVLPDPPNALREIDGVMGPAALRITRLELDWEHKCFRWE